jgi:hypothetical protein
LTHEFGAIPTETTQQGPDHHPKFGWLMVIGLQKLKPAAKLGLDEASHSFLIIVRLRSRIRINPLLTRFCVPVIDFQSKNKG